MPNFIIRKAKLQDLSTLTSIYNQAIQSGQTADTIPYEVSNRIPWFEAHQQPSYPLYIIVNEKEEVMGYATLSKYREGRPALRFAVEISYYVHEDHQRKGLGTALLNHSIETAKKLGFKHAFAILLDTNLPSIYLLEKCNFVQWGHLPNIAEIKGGVCGQYYYGRHL